LLLETSEITCDATPSPYDSKLRDITVPVLYVGAGGGFGSYGLYTLSLLGSRDIQHRIVSFRPPRQRGLDFGHVDLWTAPIAKHKLWSRIHSWLRSHAPR
jgi:hypothetical protein